MTVPLAGDTMSPEVLGDKGAPVTIVRAVESASVEAARENNIFEVVLGGVGFRMGQRRLYKVWPTSEF